MPDYTEIIDKINEILDKYELVDNLRSKLEDIVKELQTNPPDIIIAATLLACLIETLGDRMPPVISDFIKLYATALKSGIDIAGDLACSGYNKLRKQRASHEDACAVANLSPETCEWCKLRWLLDDLPPVEETDNSNGNTDSGGSISGGEWLGPMESGPPWDKEDERCCRPLSKSDLIPTVKLQDSNVVRKAIGTFFSGKLVISHQCGIKGAIVRIRMGHRVYGQMTGYGWGSLPEPHIGSSLDGRTKTYTFENFQIAKNDSNKLLIFAVSKCYGVWNGQKIVTS